MIDLTPVPKTSRRFTGVFHLFLVLFAAPARWPDILIYLVGGGISLAIAWLWRAQVDPPGNGLITFLMMAAFFISDRDLLASLPRRGISFGAWQEQILALTLPRAAVALAFGLLVPHWGWSVAFYSNVAVQFLGSIALYRGAILEPRQLSMSEHTVACLQFPAGSPPVRLLHITDLHIERLSLRELRLLDLIQTAEPDFIVLTGDYVNLSNYADPATHQDLQDLLGKLHAPGGVFAVLGSPSVDRPDIIPALFENLPVRLLRNEVVQLTGASGQSIQLIGLDCRHDSTADTNALDVALAAATGDGPRILLYHSPELMPQAVERDIDLYLCGHTHGGQVRLPIIGPLLTSSRLGRRYVMGHYREGRTNLFVSRGVGFEGLGAPRVRFLCPPQIALFHLTADA